MVKLNLVESALEVRRVSPRIIFMDLVLQGKVMTNISEYDRQSGRSEEEKETLFNDLSAEVQSRNGNFFVRSDFNAHVGTSAIEYDGVHGGFGWVQQNRNGKRILD